MKKNYRFVIAFLLTVAFLSTSVFSQRVMANDVRVFMDGVELIYTYVQPHIVNDRTMVPLRETAQHFDMEFTWNPETATMVFTGHGRTVIHTLFSDTVYVNNQPIVSEGMTSIVANDRTLMPLRMLAYAIGAAVDWDPSGIVDIWTDGGGSIGGNQQQNNQLGQDLPPPPPPAGGDARVIHAAAGRRNHDQGQPIRIQVETTRGTDRVRVTDFEGNELAQTTEFEEDFQGRYFNIYVTPEEIGEITLRVQAGNAGGFTLGAVNIIVNIIPETPPHNIVISNVRLARQSLDLRTHDRLIEGTLRTSTDVVRIEIQDNVGRRMERINRHESAFANFLTWEFDFAPTDINGSHNYNIVAFDNDGNYETHQLTITITGGRAGTGTGTGTTQTTNRIVSVSLVGGGNRVDYRQQHRFNITTSNRVTAVEVRGSGGSVLGSLSGNSFNTDSSDRRTWDVSIWADERIASDYWIYVNYDGTWYSRRVTDFMSGFNVND